MRGIHVPHTDNTPDTGPDAPPNGSSQSLASRVQQSATHLARSVFQGTSDAAQTLASATSEKPTGSGSGSGSVTISSASMGGDTSSSGDARATIRSGTNSVSGGFTLPPQTEEQFQLGDTDDLNLLDNDTDILQRWTGDWKGKQRANDFRQIYSAAWERSSSPPTTVNLQATDGAAVVSLLSDPSFNPIGVAEPTLEIEFNPAASPPALSAEEMKWLDSWRREVGASRERQQANLSSMSLVPDIDAFLQQNSPAIPTDDATSLRDAVMEQLPGAVDWIGVQDRYHDEVWGYLRPELEAAKVEIEENRDGLEDGPAVRRLKMILGHMQSS